MNWKFWVKKLKTSITLESFYDAVMEIAKEKKQTYVSVKIEKNTFDGLTLTGYYHTANHISGKTIEEVCKELRNYQIPPKESPIKKVSFEPTSLLVDSRETLSF